MSEEIFISYKSERRAAATHLSDILKAHGFSVWYDYGLISGTSFAHQINEKLNAAKIVIVLWCTKSVTSPWVLHEALTAKHNGTYFPVLMEQCDVPTEFKSDQYIDLRHWNARPTAYEPHDLIEDIERVLDRPAESDRDKLKDLRSEWTKYGSRTLNEFALSAVSPNRQEEDAPGPASVSPPDAPERPGPNIPERAETQPPPKRMQIKRQNSQMMTGSGRSMISWTHQFAKIWNDSSNTSRAIQWPMSRAAISKALSPPRKKRRVSLNSPN
tara:strand:+ start:27359 stop:28171 length:813 start_codon:yes stop_codon:yes gene_type:complete